MIEKRVHMKIAFFISISYFFLDCKTLRETKYIFFSIFLDYNFFNRYIFIAYF